MNLSKLIGGFFLIGGVILFISTLILGLDRLASAWKEFDANEQKTERCKALDELDSEFKRNSIFEIYKDDKHEFGHLGLGDQRQIVNHYNSFMPAMELCWQQKLDSTEHRKSYRDHFLRGAIEPQRKSLDLAIFVNRFEIMYKKRAVAIGVSPDQYIDAIVRDETSADIRVSGPVSGSACSAKCVDLEDRISKELSRRALKLNISTEIYVDALREYDLVKAIFEGGNTIATRDECLKKTDSSLRASCELAVKVLSFERQQVFRLSDYF